MRYGGCPGWPPRLSFDFFLTTGGFAPIGLADGGVDELPALVFRRASIAARRRFNSAISASRRWQPGQVGSSIPPCYKTTTPAAAPLFPQKKAMNGYET